MLCFNPLRCHRRAALLERARFCRVYAHGLRRLAALEPDPARAVRLRYGARVQLCRALALCAQARALAPRKSRR